MANARPTIQCSSCRKKFHEDGFRVDRLGRRLKTCLQCNARAKEARDRKKCPHGKNKLDCITCSPDAFCPHGKRLSRHTCRECDEAGNERRKHIRNAREFATQADGWPFGHIRTGEENTYDTVVNKWKCIFVKLFEDGDIDEVIHQKILGNLKPWDSEGHIRRRAIEISEREERERKRSESCEHFFCSFGCQR